MKRSEMIEDIATALVMDRLNNGTDLSWDIAQQLANVALSTAENNKMACFSHHEHEHYDDCHIVLPVYEWEKE